MVNNIDDVNLYSYPLEKSLIAQKPASTRDSSRLLILNRKTKSLTDDTFMKIHNYLSEGDCLILNDTKVEWRRLKGARDKTGGKVEILLLEKIKGSLWSALVKPSRRLKLNEKIHLINKNKTIRVAEKLDDGQMIIDIGTDKHKNFINRYGYVPLPPYITHNINEDSFHRRRYQTHFSKNNGAIAAPTAGLHFTNRVFKQLKRKNIRTGYLTLHVGIGTFAPIRTEKISEHNMHAEWFRVPKRTLNLIERTRREGKRVIAVGTTTVRALESCAVSKEMSGSTNLFIKPGYRFRYVDGMVTNFHLPGTTLMVLVSAFAGIDTIQKAYKHAIKNKYRLYSYGDAMLIMGPGL